LQSEVSKVREIRKWIGEDVLIEHITFVHGKQYASAFPTRLLDCNQFYFTAETNNNRNSFPVESTLVSFHDEKQVLAKHI
jgi:hypothetical protein